MWSVRSKIDLSLLQQWVMPLLSSHLPPQLFGGRDLELLLCQIKKHVKWQILTKSCKRTMWRCSIFMYEKPGDSRHGPGMSFLFPSWRSPTTIETFICITIPKKGHKRIATQIQTCWNHLQGVAKFGGFRRTVHVLQLHKVDGFTQVRFQKHNSTNLGVGYFLTWCKASFVILKTLHPRATLNERIQRWLYSTPLQFRICLKKNAQNLHTAWSFEALFLVGGRRRTHRMASTNLQFLVAFPTPFHPFIHSSPSEPVICATAWSTSASRPLVTSPWFRSSGSVGPSFK